MSLPILINDLGLLYQQSFSTIPGYLLSSLQAVVVPYYRINLSFTLTFILKRQRHPIVEAMILPRKMLQVWAS